MPPSALTVLGNNPRKIDADGLRTLMDSIRTNGFWRHRPIAAEQQPDGSLTVLDGNQRLKAARRLKMKQVPVVIYTDLTPDERNDLILRSNILNGEWRPDLLASDFGTVDFQAIGLDIELPTLDIDTLPSTAPAVTTKPDAPPPSESQSTEQEAEQEADTDWLQTPDIRDVLYPSDNDMEIPTLLTDLQPGRLELPFSPWGANSRLKKGVATYHFYVDDYRFEKLWRDPSALILSGCHAIVEPNCSLHDQTPIAYGLQLIYKKRWLARLLQDYGIRVYADLNVARKFQEWNRLGIPQGYNAFMTRGNDTQTGILLEDLRIAQEISGLEQPNLIIYGGGRRAQEFAQQHGLLYTSDFMTDKHE